MILEIKPLRDDYTDCFENSLLTITSWLGRSHELMFSQSWRFYFDDSNFHIPDDNKWKLLEKYSGITLNIHNPRNASEVMEIAKEQFKIGMPLIMYLDNFWNITSPYYQKKHTAHFCVAVGINDEESGLYYLDTWFLKEGLFIPVEHLEQGFGRCASLSLKNNKAEYSCKDIIKEAVEGFIELDKQHCVIKAINDLGNNIQKDRSFLTDKLNGYSSPFDIPFMKEIEQVKNQHGRFLKTLRFLYRESEDENLIYLNDSFSLLTTKWSIFYNLLVKSFHNNSAIAHEKVGRVVKEIAEYEKSIVKEMQKISQKISISSHSVDKHKADNVKNEINEYIYVNLNSFFNNHGFGNHEDKMCTADFDGTGKFWINKDLPDSEIWHVENMKFHVPKINFRDNDNVSCRSQVIPISTGNYSKIMILGCCEWGDYAEKAVINYTNGKTQDTSIKFSNWRLIPQNPIFGESIAWNGWGYDEGIIGNRKLYAQSYSLSCDNAIESISLPDCPNMHIFAITVGR